MKEPHLPPGILCPLAGIPTRSNSESSIRFGVPLLAIWALIAPAFAQDEPVISPHPPGILDLTGKTTPDEVQKAYYNYIWESFVALNWPSEPLVIKKGKDGQRTITKGTRGVPDESKTILDQTGKNPIPFSVWETFKEPGEVFLEPEDWADYPDWNTPRPQPPGTDPDARRYLQFSRNFAEYATDINQPYFFPKATGPLVDQNGNFVRYEVGINESFFTYIKHFQYYNANRQIMAVRYTVENPPTKPIPPLAPRPLPGFQRPPHGYFGNQPEYKKYFASNKDLPNETYLENTTFPEQGLIDVKAAWRVLGKKDHPERYLHRRLVIDEDGDTQLMGLVALHILRFLYIKDINPVTKKPAIASGYVAATFEQVDNVSVCPDAKKAGIKPSFNDGGPPNAVEREYGFDYSIPPLATKNNPDPQAPVSIYRVKAQELSQPIQDINKAYQAALNPSVFQYYELIGTQNKTPDKFINFNAPPKKGGGGKPDLDRNGHQGPITGVYTNTNNLVNSALESYTQKNFSCILCHVKARPQGVPEKAFEEDYFKTLTFLLRMAQSRSAD